MLVLAPMWAWSRVWLGTPPLPQAGTMVSRTQDPRGSQARAHPDTCEQLWGRGLEAVAG